MIDEERLLKEKAQLLIARERELTALRKRHDRVTAWLGVAQRVPELLSKSFPDHEIFERFAQMLVVGLQFQRVVIAELSRNGTLQPLHGAAAPPEELTALAPAVMEQLLNEDSGICNAPRSEPDQELSRSLGLSRFLWYRINRPGRSWLLVAAGYDAERAVFYAAFDQADLGHFRSLGHHLEVVLGNMALMSELESDKQRLEQFNQELERRVGERTGELLTMNQKLVRALDSLREKEQRLNADLEQARTFQQSILPQLPRVPGIGAAACYRPLEHVGGDIYDVCLLRGGSMRVFVADATGHGLQAAMRTIVLKAEYDRLKYGADTPDELLAAFNRSLVTLYGTTEMLSTACCFDLVPDDQGAAIRYVNAAHPPLLCAGPAGLREIYEDGPFLGLHAQFEVASVNARLGRGERLLAYTDGLVDQQDTGGASFDLRAALRELLADDPLPGYLARLTERFDRFRGSSPMSDDLTLLVFEATGPAASTL